MTADKAPAAIVGLVGRKEYEQCAKDLYYFLQVTVILELSYSIRIQTVKCESVIDIS